MTTYKYCLLLNNPSVYRMDPRWNNPLTSVVAGPTSCGKTEWVKRFISHLYEMVTPTPTKIVWSYGEWQPTYQSLLGKVQFVQGLPYLPLYSTEPLLLVIDDQMHNVDQRISTLFTKGSHHRNISVIYIVQNLFDQHKEHRTISLNAHYLVIFKNPRDRSQITHLAKQMYPGKTNYVQQAFELATAKPHGYLLVDIFPGENQQVYMQD